MPNVPENDQFINYISEPDTIEEWMKLQMEEVRSSTDKLNEEIMEVYKRMMEKGAAKAKSTRPDERTELTEEMQQMEYILGDISRDVTRRNEEAIEKMSQFRKDSEQRGKELAKRLEQKAEDQKSDSEHEQQEQKIYNEKWTEENQQIKRFLGKWIGNNDSKGSIEIGSDTTTGLYYCHHFYNVKSDCLGNLWLPDGVVRSEIRATLEGNLLTIMEDWLHNPLYSDEHSYELREEGLKFNGSIYLPEK